MAMQINDQARPAQDYLISTTYLKVLLNEPGLIQALQDTVGEDYLELFSEEYVSGADIEPVFQTFADAGLDSWVIRFGERLGSTTHGPLGFAALTAPDLDTALRVFTDYASIRTTAYSSQLVEMDKRLHLVASDQTGSDLVGRWLIEVGMRVAQGLIENIMAHPLGNNALIRFSMPEPSYADELRSYFQIPCEFNAPENSFSIPSSWAGIPSPLSDPGTFQSNLSKCKELLQALNQSPNVLQAVQLALEQFFDNCVAGNARPSNMPTLNSLASKLALSPRTLARRLEQHGSSYKNELERVRRKHATHLLKNTHLRIADIAYYLAYQEPANFTRAFKNWFNSSPNTWRRGPKNIDSEEISYD